MHFQTALRFVLPACFSFCLLSIGATASGELPTRAVELSGKNLPEIQRAYEEAPAGQKKGMLFLLTHMPERDLETLKADFLLKNVDQAYRVRKELSWEIPDDVFLNNVLPYANINEQRDDFRNQFYERFSKLVKDAKSPGEAAAILNNKIFKELNVKYSRKRRRADQGPFESMESGLASCTGLSVLLIDACRSVGVPARFVGTPLWSDNSGNHSWVEVWDDGWHFTGAAEPTGMDLDKGWFIGRSSKAKRDDPRHAIYAVSYKHTPTKFPLVWDRSIDYVHAVNVTDRYANKAKDLPPNHTYAMFKTYGIGGERCCTPFQIRDENGKVVFSGKTKDESFDGNDHTTVPLPIGANFDVVFDKGENQKITTLATESRSQLFAFSVPEVFVAAEAKSSANASAATDTDPVDQLAEFLAQEDLDWDAVGAQDFATTALSKDQASRAKELLIAARRKQLMQERAAELKSLGISLGDKKMPFFYKTYGEKPKGGRSLFISMHGGGGAPARVNDQQWNNQKRLYEPTEGVYVAPRAPTDTWNLWHEKHIMPMFDRLIEDMVVLEDVDPNRVYVMGYSAGGDGVYQLAPRMADRWAAAAMMAGHPNDARPLNLRNIAFALYMGGKDGAYKRNQVAAEWAEKLRDLRRADRTGYRYLATIYPEKGHWMEREDASSLPWMMQFTRNPLPTKIVWRKDGNPQSRFYWLGADVDQWTNGETLTAEISDQTVSITAADSAEPPKGLGVYLNDDLLDLSQEVVLKGPGGEKKVTATRTIAVMHESLTHRFDPGSVFSAYVAE